MAYVVLTDGSPSQRAAPEHKQLGLRKLLLGLETRNMFSE